MNHAKSRWMGIILPLAAGGVLGIMISVTILYKRPFNEQFDRVKAKLGLVETNSWDNYEKMLKSGLSFVERASTWKAVESPTHPEWNVAPGFDVELVAEGLTYPVSLAFAREPGDDPDAPLFYLTELDGEIKYVGRDGGVRPFAGGFKNVPPYPMDRSDELGLIGLTALSDSDDLVITHAHRDEETGILINRIVRLVVEPGGKAVEEARTLLQLDERTSPSHQVQAVVEGPDGALYVAVGDGLDYSNAMDLSKFGGKILRMNKDGSPCEDNPFFEESFGEGSTPRDYIYAYGFRNAFDLAFQPDSGRLFTSENGENIDRLIQVVAGGAYGWDGVNASSRLNALYSWGPEPTSPAPAGMRFLHAPALGEGSAGRFYIGMYGKHATDGPGEGLLKSIVEVQVDPETGLLFQIPRPIVQYKGEARATVLDLAEGPDGLYFTDFYGSSLSQAGARGAGRVWKVVPSRETLDLPELEDGRLASLEPEQRGSMLFAQNCTTCHSLDGRGGTEGPRLDNLATTLGLRLGSSAYEATLESQKAKGLPPEMSERIEEILALEPGEDRTRAWLKHHLEEPRFDNPYARMPSFMAALSEEQRDDLIRFLLRQE